MSHPPLSALFQQPAFIRFWFARLAGVMANQMLMVAVGWQMYDLTSSAWDLGLVGLFQFLPALLLTLPAGHVADRWHRGRIFAATMGLQATVAAWLFVSCGHGAISREIILGLAALLGVARAFQGPAHQSITPLLVPQRLVPRAVTFSSTGMEFAVIAGPALGGLLYIWGAALVFASCAVLLGIAISLALCVRYDHQPRQTAATWRSVLAGIGFVWKTKVLVGAFSLDLFAVLLGGATALLPIYAKDILHVGPEGLGVLRAAPSLGALLMSVALIRWPMHRHVGHKMLGAVAVFGLATLVFGVSTQFWVSLVALAVAGAADNISVVIRSTIMQLDTPDELRGRVSAVNSIFTGASNQLGEFESGAVAAVVGPVGSVILGGVGTLVVAFTWMKIFPALAQRDRIDRPAAA